MKFIGTKSALRSSECNMHFSKILYKGLSYHYDTPDQNCAFIELNSLCHTIITITSISPEKFNYRISIKSISSPSYGTAIRLACHEFSQPLSDIPEQITLVIEAKGTLLLG